jgi:hypothetical protein
METKNDLLLAGIDLGKLNISRDDKPTVKLLMLIEGAYCIGVGKSIEKYGFSEQRYYQIRKSFMERGSDALFDLKRGPRGNHVRSEDVGKLIIRMRYLDPDLGAAVIAQKLNQQGIYLQT